MTAITQAGQRSARAALLSDTVRSPHRRARREAASARACSPVNVERLGIWAKLRADEDRLDPPMSRKPITADGADTHADRCNAGASAAGPAVSALRISFDLQLHAPAVSAGGPAQVSSLQRQKQKKEKGRNDDMRATAGLFTRRSTRLAAAGALVAAALAAGCSDRQAAKDDIGSDGPLAPVITTLDDDRIVATVRSDYFTSDQVKAENIDVTSNHGVVTLTGTVGSNEARDRAIAIADDVEGVSKVNDQLTVAPEAVTASSEPEGGANGTHDAGRVTTRILAQYYVTPGLKPWNIDVTTSQDGVVTLEGRIDNDTDRAEAVRIARNTEGVTDVRDHLRAGDVAATAGTVGENKAGAQDTGGDSDPWITAQVQSRFFLDPDVKGRHINVDTNDGVVTLRGGVDSFSERRQAVNIARNIGGVREVRDELRVEPGASTGRSAAASARLHVDDAWITTKIQSKYFIDDAVQGSQIDVTTKNGVVTLSGTVGSQAAKDMALQLARDTDGVRTVRDRLVVETCSRS
jgi:osmotically-inducible protein OsmY